MNRQGKLRDNKCCENCGHYVERRFCPECGQENIETRQRFYYLFSHYILDVIHYDSKFWKTIKYLLFRPAKLTNEYLSGKRKSYTAPVTLYIFICFITFSMPAVINFIKEKKDEIAHENNKDKKNPEELISIKIDGKNVIEDQKIEEDGESLNIKKIEENLKKHFSKAVFFYMPVFAFWLWLFHSKKKWYYFDHGIFTLHYFSLVLLSSLLFYFISSILLLLKIEKNTVDLLIVFVLFSYLIYYFFHSHRLVYGERKAISRIKCTFLFFINTFCMQVFLLLYIIIQALLTDNNAFSKIIDMIND